MFKKWIISEIIKQKKHTQKKKGVHPQKILNIALSDLFERDLDVSLDLSGDADRDLCL